MTEWRIALADLDLGDAEVEALTEVIRSRWLTMGPRTEAFEEAFARQHGVRHAIAVSSCTAALHLAFGALDLAPGDEVIVPALTFVATANTAVQCGARPVFADILGDEEPTLDPAHVGALITPRTRAIAVVHYAGHPCRMEALSALARRHGLALIEDCAHAPGVAFRGRFLGAWGTVGCFSFFSNKNMTTAEGGMLTTADDAIAERVRLLRSHGMTSGTWKRHQERPRDYDVISAGWNYRIDELRAAIGLVQLRKLARNNARRLEVARRYRDALFGAPRLTVPFARTTEAGAAHIQPVLVDTVEARAALVSLLARQGIQTSHHYPPVHLFAYYRERYGLRPGLLPRTESFAAREVTLPLHAGLADEEVDEVTRTVRDGLEHADGEGRRLGGHP